MNLGLRPMEARRRAGRRHRGAGRGLRPCGAAGDAARPDAARRRVRRRRPALWRLDQSVQPFVQCLRLASEVGRHRRHCQLRSGHRPEDQGGLHRVHRQSRRSVSLGVDYICVTQREHDWSQLMPSILGTIMEHFVTLQPIDLKELKERKQRRWTDQRD